MRFEITRKEERGANEFGWLKARHYFSFGMYQDPDKMGFGRLRVINDDTIAPATGFDTHPHRNMEIITIPLEGALAHRDSEGNSGVIRKGEVQVMSAGSGIRHSEHNASNDETLKLFQIWIEPNKANVEPRYDQKMFSYQDKKNQWTQLIAPMNSQEEGIKIYQNAFINVAPVNADTELSYNIKSEGNGAYLLLAEGKVEVNGEVLNKRDSIAVADVKSLQIKAIEESEVVVIEVPLQ